MGIKTYYNDNHYIAGMTLKAGNRLESNSMALHTCQQALHVLKNRELLAESLNCSLDEFVCANQTHSANFRKVTQQDRGKGARKKEEAIEDVDALYTYEANVLLTCFTADCVPVILLHEGKGLMGVIHSGWQGTVKEITPKLLKHLIQEERCDPKGFKVFLGAALSQKRFEVDEDVYVKYKKLGYADEFIYFESSRNKYHIDNQGTVKKQCELAGIPASQIFMDKTCTYDSEDGFSYRQDKTTGRHLSFIMKK